MPDDWRATYVLAPARLRLATGTALVRYEDPGLLRRLERGFAKYLASHSVASLDIPALRSKDRAVSQFFGRLLYDQGYAGIVFASGLPPGGPCLALFEGRAWLEPDGPQRPLTAAMPALRAVSTELGLALSS